MSWLFMPTLALTEASQTYSPRVVRGPCWQRKEGPCREMVRVGGSRVGRQALRKTLKSLSQKGYGCDLLWCIRGKKEPRGVEDVFWSKLDVSSLILWVDCILWAEMEDAPPPQLKKWHSFRSEKVNVLFSFTNCPVWPNCTHIVRSNRTRFWKVMLGSDSG